MNELDRPDVSGLCPAGTSGETLCVPAPRRYIAIQTIRFFSEFAVVNKAAVRRADIPPAPHPVTYRRSDMTCISPLLWVLNIDGDTLRTVTVAALSPAEKAQNDASTPPQQR